jgi:hypothetical protein
VRAAWWAAIALAACGDGGDGRPDAASEPDAAASAVQLVVGSATRDATAFVDVEDGADVELVPGSQGGFHVWTGIRLHGAAGRLRVKREARRAADGVLVLLAPALVMEVPAEAMDDWWERPSGDPNALPSFMCPTPIGIRVRDEPLTLRTELLDDDDNPLAEDTLLVTPRCPEDDEAQAEFCVEICSG